MFPDLPEKPYAISCDRNSEPILKILKEKLTEQKNLLEVGSGTGQHAIFMAPSLSHLTWTLSDRRENHEGISVWLNDYPRANLRGPLEYDISQHSFPKGDFDTVFTSNTLHILSWELCLQFFNHLGENLQKKALFVVYGAFNYDGQFTSESNERFEKWLKERDPQSGIRDFESVKEELAKRGFDLIEDVEMPANNRMLFFKKV